MKKISIAVILSACLIFPCSGGGSNSNHVTAPQLVKVSAGDYHTIALESNGTAWKDSPVLIDFLNRDL